jgi:hypothetical protein
VLVKCHFVQDHFQWKIQGKKWNCWGITSEEIEVMFMWAGINAVRVWPGISSLTLASQFRPIFFVLKIKYDFLDIKLLIFLRIYSSVNVWY